MSNVSREVYNVSNRNKIVMVHVSSILILSLKYITMKITNKITGKDVTKEYLALMQGIITKKEFELITLTIK